MNDETHPRPRWQGALLLAAIVALGLAVVGSLAISLRFWQG